MGNVSFFSMCPACKRARLQNGYTRGELAAALNTDRTIDAYCLMCDVVWPLDAQERLLIGAQLGTDRAATPESPSAEPTRTST